MLIVATYLDKSPVHGIGVFAKEFIPQGTKIWEFHPWFDLKIPPEVFDKLPPSAREEIEHHLYVPEKDGPYYYEATMGKYMNHSREPNVDFSKVDEGRALRDIYPNEELTCDYRHFMAEWEHIPYI